uniref:Hydantoinase B/oxoprolinase domain-containing protein n=1 Tax=Ananas comosus var. bracteatus TaxID=296719 RepID=A0A6V7PCW4_ANACO|nr:unnamed protein product [Ananas comosus var. bracteatus]
MNNLTFGDDTFGYYETIGGGCGAGPTWDGTSGVQCHMTNTRMTDPEIFEQREIEFRRPVVVSILSERRVHAPRGLKGGKDGARGANYLIRKDKRKVYLGGKTLSRLMQVRFFRFLLPGVVASAPLLDSSYCPVRFLFLLKSFLWNKSNSLVSSTKRKL